MTNIAFADWQFKAAALRLKRSGAELKGPCPVCGGKDRFSVRKGRDGRALIYCRGCDPGQRNPDAFRAIVEAAGFSLDPTAPRRPPRPAKPVRRIVPANDEPAWFTAEMEALRLHTSKGTARAADSPFRHPAVRKADDG